MTQKHIIELIQLDFPSLNDSIIRIMMNQAMVEFANDTHVLRGSDTQASDGTNIRFNLPADCVELEEVYDSADGTELRHGAQYQFQYAKNGEMLWWVENGQLVIGYVNLADKTFNPIESGYTFELRYRRNPTVFTAANLDDDIDLPEAFHDAIEARLKEKLFARDPELRRYWHAVYSDKVKKAFRYGNHQQDGGDFNILIDDMFTVD